MNGVPLPVPGASEGRAMYAHREDLATAAPGDSRTLRRIQPDGYKVSARASCSPLLARPSAVATPNRPAEI
jgi:hypothetical protein